MQIETTQKTDDNLFWLTQSTGKTPAEIIEYAVTMYSTSYLEKGSAVVPDLSHLAGAQFV